jgi:Mn-containing catalase
MHQNQWLAAIKELEEEGLDRTPVPANFPQELEKQEVAYQFIDASEGSESQQGRWARGPSVDGKGQFTYAKIQALTDDEGLLGQVDPRTYGTPASPLPAQAAE